jgi:hypothetical protein
MELHVPTDEELFTQTADETQSDEAEKVEETKPAEEEKVEEAVEEEKTKPEANAETQAPHMVPLRELLDEREKRQQAQAQYEAMQAHLAQQQALAQQEQAAQQGQQAMPDIFENPEFYQQAIAQMQQWPAQIQAQMQQQMNQQLAMQRHELMGEASLQRAQASDPDTFNAAWGELENRSQSGDNTWRHQVLTSQNPGETLVALYKREHVAAEVGNDPDAYVNKRLEELKQDPKFLQEVLEAAQAKAGGGGEPSRIDMPSLNKAGGGGSIGSISGTDLWDRINN